MFSRMGELHVFTGGWLLGEDDISTIHVPPAYINCSRQLS